MSTAEFTCYAFKNVPPFARGVVRDLRVRWALEECELPYHTRLVGDGALDVDDYRAVQPFGQIPALATGELQMFESGAIVLHLAEQHEALMSREPVARAHTKQWMFAALNTIEPGISELAEIDLFHPGEAWTAERRPQVVELVQSRLKVLASRLEGKDYLVGRFTAADLLMVTVLRALRHTRILDDHPALLDYQQRGEARQAFQRALAGQLGDFAPWREELA